MSKPHNPHLVGRRDGSGHGKLERFLREKPRERWKPHSERSATLVEVEMRPWAARQGGNACQVHLTTGPRCNRIPPKCCKRLRRDNCFSYKTIGRARSEKWPGATKVG
jgi:hypothetical protein